MNARMPASVLTQEGQAWLALGKAEMRLFRERDNGGYFAGIAAVQRDYAKLTPTKFLAKHGDA